MSVSSWNTLRALAIFSCALNTLAHGGTEHPQIEVAPDADWATRHMAGSYTHHIVVSCVDRHG